MPGLPEEEINRLGLYFDRFVVLIDRL